MTLPSPGWIRVSISIHSFGPSVLHPLLHATAPEPQLYSTPTYSTPPHILCRHKPPATTTTATNTDIPGVGNYGHKLWFYAQNNPPSSPHSRKSQELHICVSPTQVHGARDGVGGMGVVINNYGQLPTTIPAFQPPIPSQNSTVHALDVP